MARYTNVVPEGKVSRGFLVEVNLPAWFRLRHLLVSRL
jgi:hypothetical protein